MVCCFCIVLSNVVKNGNEIFNNYVGLFSHDSMLDNSLLITNYCIFVEPSTLYVICKWKLKAMVSTHNLVHNIISTVCFLLPLSLLIENSLGLDGQCCHDLRRCWLPPTETVVVLELV